MSGLTASLRVGERLSAELEIGPGEVVAVIGPNGAGKSTMLSALAGIEPGGQVSLADRDWSRLPIKDRDLGFVFQDQSLFPHLSAADNVSFGLRCRGATRADADRQAREWLDAFGLAALAERRPGRLSGGQAQRVAIARALAPRPELLLLDEPFAGLDVGVATALRLDLARHLRSYDGITLLVTHEAIDAITLATRVLVLEGGLIVQQGSPAEVAARPLTDHVARLVGLNVIRAGGRCAAFPPSAVAVSRTRPEGSARHVWSGVVESAVPHGDAVRLRIASTPSLLADVTPAAAAALDLAPGTEVWLAAKETAMTWYDDLPRPSAG
ncbi:MAG: ABC transporter ATP-binding protein [Nocardioides sp.]|jgi:molybdate transport system ATP-binding protein